jgi:hypothetical protein
MNAFLHGERMLQARRTGRRILVVSVIAACAQASPPPGGEPDRTPPRIIETIPAQNAVVPGFSGVVRIRFDETLSERGPREGEMAFVSPETGEVDVDRDGKELKVKIAGGWQPGRVYHVVVFPGFVDRRGNARPDAYELVFSTGPEILPTVLGGMVEDRLTGRAVANARVVAIATDSTAYTTLTDSAGFFSLRSLPLGTFRTLAYLDQNRNREMDGLEARAETVTTLAAVTDTPIVELSVLALDTTPARLLSAEASDSARVTLAFDDFITAEEQISGVSTTVWLLPDSARHPGGELLRLRDVQARQRAEAEARLRALGDTIRPPPVETGAAADTTARKLPSQTLVWVPRTPLVHGARYRITVFGIRNIGGVPGGGGSVVFEVPAARPPAAVDTTAAPPPDSAAVRPPPADTISH